MLASINIYSCVSFFLVYKPPWSLNIGTQRCFTSEQLESPFVLGILNVSRHCDTSQGEFLVTVESRNACYRFELSVRQERLKQVCANGEVVDKVFSLKKLLS